VQEARADVADTETDVAMTEIAETDAHQAYRDAIKRVEDTKP
jgi:hypothetical protein